MEKEISKEKSNEMEKWVSETHTLLNAISLSLALTSSLSLVL